MTEINSDKRKDKTQNNRNHNNNPTSKKSLILSGS